MSLGHETYLNINEVDRNPEISDCEVPIFQEGFSNEENLNVCASRPVRGLFYYVREIAKMPPKPSTGTMAFRFIATLFLALTSVILLGFSFSYFLAFFLPLGFAKLIGYGSVLAYVVRLVSKID